MRAKAIFTVLAALAPMLACFASLDGYAGGAEPAPGADAGSGAAPTSVPADAGARDGATVAPSDAYGAAVVADGPASYFRFEDAPGVTAIADTIGANPGPLYGELVLGVDGAVGHGARFDGSSGFKLGSVFDFGGLTELTIEFWGQDDNPTNDYESVLFKRSADENQSALDGWVFFLDKYDRTMQYQFWADGTVNAQAITNGAVKGLHHFVVTRTVSGQQLALEMYLDGVPQTADTSRNFGSTGPEPGNDSPLVVGASWHGLLDELAFYDHALTADRVLAHFDAAKR